MISGFFSRLTIISGKRSKKHGHIFLRKTLVFNSFWFQNWFFQMHASNILSTYYWALCEGLSTVSIVCIIILSTNDKSYYNWLQDQIAPASKTLQFYKIDEEKSRLKDIRIMCLVMTHPGNHKTKALQVSN